MFESLVNDRRQCRYTVEQAFRGIQAFVADYCGEKVVLELDEPLTSYEQAARDSHECPLQFLEDLASYFQFQWSEGRWAIWLQLRDDSLKTEKQRQAAWVHWQQAIAPRFTVRKLAELVARKARVPSFEPVTILGSRCEPAGAFLGLCSLPEARRQRLAPSTPLRAIRSSRRLRELWKRAEWINDVKLPQLAEPSPWRFRSAADVAQLVVCCTAAVAAAGSACLIWQIGTWFFAGLAAVMAGIVTLIVGDAVVDRIHDPLPREVQRFGDLARLISAQRRRPT